MNIRFAFFFASLMVLPMGCSGKSEEEFKSLEPDKDVKPAVLKHEHGPHGGHVADLGDGKTYRVEVTIDSKTRDITVFLLNPESGSVAKVVPEEVELHLKGASPQSLEAVVENDTKAWRLAGSQVPEAIDNIEKVHGHVHVKIQGEELEAEFQEDHDDEHEHQH